MVGRIAEPSVSFGAPGGRALPTCYSPYETISIDESTDCLLKIIRELVSRLIQLDIIRAWNNHHDDSTVLGLLDGPAELRSFCSQLIHRHIDVIAH